MNAPETQQTGEERPRVLHCIPRIGLGGSERVAINLASGLREQFHFDFFAVRGMEDGTMARELLDEMRTLGLRVHLGVNLPMRLGGLLTSAMQLGRVIRRVRPHLVHVHTEIPEAALAILLAFSPTLRALPVVRTVHNTVIWDFSPRLSRWCDRQLSQAFVTGVSSGAVEAFLALRRASGAAAPPVPPRVVYNGIRPPKTRSGAGRADELRVVFGGRLERQKGADLIPGILAQVRPSIPARLVIFGAGSEASRLRDLERSPPRGWSVELNAPVYEFAERLCEFDLCLMPSRYEGLGLVAVEALLAGVPVIATRIAGLDEVFPPAYPWLARPGDAQDFARVLQLALDHWEQAPVVLENARSFAQPRFSLEAMVTAYGGLYREALDAAGGVRVF